MFSSVHVHKVVVSDQVASRPPQRLDDSLVRIGSSGLRLYRLGAFYQESSFARRDCRIPNQYPKVRGILLSCCLRAETRKNAQELSRSLSTTVVTLSNFRILPTQVSS